MTIRNAAKISEAPKGRTRNEMEQQGLKSLRLSGNLLITLWPSRDFHGGVSLGEP